MGDAMRMAAKIGRHRVDIVFGGAPCQGQAFRSWVRERSTIRVTLWSGSSFASSPSWRRAYFVFEHVKGLTVGKQRRFLEEVIEAFDDILAAGGPSRALSVPLLIKSVCHVRPNFSAGSNAASIPIQSARCG